MGGIARTPHQRGPSAKDLLRMQWDFPVYKPVEAEKTDATTVRMRQALSREAAITYLAGTDPRPLLVVRECRVCNKTDDALLTPGADNERTILLSRWFHCVKLPVDVLQKDHPFNALFPDKSSEHLFVAQRDGASKVPLESATSRTELWAAMSTILGAAYSKDPVAVAKEIAKSFDRLDVLDKRVVELEQRRDDLMESDSKPDLAKIKKVGEEIDGTKRDIARMLDSIQKQFRIDVKPEAPAAK